jgi:hypothetical protein
MTERMLSLMSSVPDKILEIKEMKEEKMKNTGLMLKIQMMAPCLS